MSRCDNSGKLIAPASLKRGDSVAVISGVLADFVATVETIDSEKRIWLLMEVMGQLTKVQVASDQIRTIN